MTGLGRGGRHGIGGITLLVSLMQANLGQFVENDGALVKAKLMTGFPDVLPVLVVAQNLLESSGLSG